MSYESGQLDAIDRELMETGAPPKASEWTEIGEAEIAYTIFGNAKVRIVRKHDKMRRLVFLLLSMAVVVLAWQGWVLFDRTKQQVNVSDPLPIKQDMEDLGSASPSPANNKPESNAALAAIGKKSEPQQNQDGKGSNQTAMKPFVHQPMRVIRPQSAPVATNNNSPLINQTDMQLQNPISPKITVAPAIAPLHTTQAAASGSVPTTPFVPAMNKAESPKQSSGGDNQMTDQNGAKRLE